MSPLPFALMIEPLPALIRAHPGIRGFRRGNMEEKIALYADDMLLFLEDASNSLDMAAKVIETFGTYSGLSINWDKSVLMPVADPSHICGVLRIPFNILSLI